MKKKLEAISPVSWAIWAIGFVTFFMNISTAMVFSLSAVYLKTVLGVSMGWIGVLEGVVEGVAYALKVFSGVLSDYLRRRRLIMITGYGLILLSRPILALSASFEAVFTARIFDRIGNGIQATPRDALISDIAPPESRGTCFGLSQTLRTAGSLVGGVVAIGIMRLTHNHIQHVFWLAIIPATLALLILCLAVQDKTLPSPAPNTPIKSPIDWSALPRLGRLFWGLMTVVSIFMLARVSEAFLILHVSQNFGLANEWIPLIMILYNGTYSFSSYPVGRLSDHFGRYTLLGIGIGVLVLTDIILAFASNLPLVLIGVACWGIQMGVTQAMFLSLIADIVPADMRGTGFGIFYLISSVSLGLSGVGAGQISEYAGEGMAFATSGIVGLVSLGALLVISQFYKKKG